METGGSCWRDAPGKGGMGRKARERRSLGGKPRSDASPATFPGSPCPVHLPNLVIPEDASLRSSSEPWWAGGLGEARTGCGRRSGVRAGAPTLEPISNPRAARSLLPSTERAPPAPRPSSPPHVCRPRLPLYRRVTHIPDRTGPGLGGKTLLGLRPPEDTPRKPRQEARGQPPDVTQGAHTHSGPVRTCARHPTFGRTQKQRGCPRRMFC